MSREPIRSVDLAKSVPQLARHEMLIEPFEQVAHSLWPALCHIERHQLQDLQEQTDRGLHGWPCIVVDSPRKVIAREHVGDAGMLEELTALQYSHALAQVDSRVADVLAGIRKRQRSDELRHKRDIGVQGEQVRRNLVYIRPLVDLRLSTQEFFQSIRWNADGLAEEALPLAKHDPSLRSRRCRPCISARHSIEQQRNQLIANIGLRASEHSQQFG